MHIRRVGIFSSLHKKASMSDSDSTIEKNMREKVMKWVKWMNIKQIKWNWVNAKESERKWNKMSESEYE